MDEFAAAQINSGMVAEIAVGGIGVEAHHIAALQIGYALDLGIAVIVTLALCAGFQPYSRLLEAIVHKTCAVKGAGRGGVGRIALAQLILRHIDHIFKLCGIGRGA